jgi:hypothetical protein
VPVAMHTSAQSMFRRMHWVSCATMSSPRHASAHDVQTCAQSKHLHLRMGADHLMCMHASLLGNVRRAQGLDPVRQLKEVQIVPGLAP